MASLPLRLDASPLRTAAIGFKWAPFGHRVAIRARLSDGCGRSTHTRGTRDDRSTPPSPGQRRPLGLGSGPLCLPRGEGQSLGLQTNGRVIRPDALALLRRAQLDSGSGQARRRAGLGPRHRQVWADTLLDYSGGSDRLPVLPLQIPHPDGPGRLQSMRCHRTTTDDPVGRPRIQRRRGTTAPGRGARHRRRKARSGNPADADTDRPAPDRSDLAPRRRPEHRRRDLLLRVPGYCVAVSGPAYSAAGGNSPTPLSRPFGRLSRMPARSWRRWLQPSRSGRPGLDRRE